MKATIDLDDALYRRLKVEAARRGRTIRDLVGDGLRRVLDAPSADTEHGGDEATASTPWFGALKEYGANARGRHDLASIRGSITRGRRRSRR